MIKNSSATAAQCIPGAGSFSMGLSDYNTESLTAAHSRSHVWRVPCSRHIKHLFCTFWKKRCIVATTIFFLSIPNSPYFFCGSQQSLTYFNHSFPCFYIVLIYHLSCSCPQYSSNITRWSNNQSILIKYV